MRVQSPDSFNQHIDLGTRIRNILGRKGFKLPTQTMEDGTRYDRGLDEEAIKASLANGGHIEGLGPKQEAALRKRYNIP